MEIILIIIGVFFLSLLSNALANLVIFDEGFAITTDATSVIFNFMLSALLIPLCSIVLLTRLVVYLFNMLFEYCSDKLLDYRLNKTNRKSVKKDETKE